MSSITINGFTFTLSASNRVILTGTKRSIDLGSIDTFSTSSFISNFKGSPSVEGSEEALTNIATNNIAEILAALQPKPSESSTPPATEPEPVKEEPTSQTTQTGDALDQAASNSDNQQQDDSNKDSTSVTKQSTASDTASPTPASGGPVVVTSSRLTAPSGNMPGQRLHNPLAEITNSTYQLSLYMLNPDSIASLVASNFKTINDLLKVEGSDGIPNAYIIAQSGGIGDSAIRMPDAPFDYYIDNLQFETILLGKTAASTGLEFKFQIIEPMGFSLTTKIVRASEKLYSKSKMVDSGSIAKNPLNQHFVLGIRFMGYEQDGTIAKNTRYGPTEQGSTENSFFERFYLIKITGFEFTLDGRQTVYNISAQPYASVEAQGQKRGIVAHETTLDGKTVEDMLKEFEEMLNRDEQEFVRAGKYKHSDVYKILYEQDSTIPKSEFSTIIQARRNTPTSTSKSGDSPVAEGQRNQAVRRAARLSFSQGPIMNIIDKIIIQSDYVTKSIRRTIGATDDNEDEDDSTQSQGGERLNWYHINPKVVPIKWDDQRNDWACEITYQIHEYAIPYVRSPYVGSTAKYNGPHKRYKYWLTGENSEVISYQQTINNLFYVLFAQTDNDPKDSHSGNANKSAKGAAPTATDSQGGGTAGDTVRQIKTSLGSPSDLAEFKMTIIGDPDYLTQSAPGFDTLNSNYYKRFSAYSYDGFTINPNGGQVFIELEFKEGIDYGAELIGDKLDISDDGLMGISDAITFYHPRVYSKQSVNKNHVVYMLRTVTSKFERGKFTQDIEGFLVDPTLILKNGQTGAGLSSSTTPDNFSREYQSQVSNSGPVSSRVSSLLPERSTASSASPQTSSRVSSAVDKDSAPTGLDGYDANSGSAQPPTYP